jgi:hypothetical protein
MLFGPVTKRLESRLDDFHELLELLSHVLHVLEFDKEYVLYFFLKVEINIMGSPDSFELLNQLLDEGSGSHFTIDGLLVSCRHSHHFLYNLLDLFGHLDNCGESHEVTDDGD